MLGRLTQHLAFALVLVLGGTTPGSPGVAAQSPTRMVAHSMPVMGIGTDGRFVVWKDITTKGAWPNLEKEAHIYAASLQERQAFLVATLPGEDTSRPSIDGGIVVWQQPRSAVWPTARAILGVDLATRQQIIVSATEADETSPLISGHRVVWIRQSPTTRAQQVMMRDIRSTTMPVALTAPSQVNLSQLSAGRDFVVWMEYRSPRTYEYEWRVLRLMVGENEPAIMESGTAWNLPYIGAAGDIVYLYHQDRRLLEVFDARTLTRLTTIESGPGRAGPRVTAADGRYIFWRDSPPPLSVHGSDLLTKSAFDVLADIGEPDHVGGGMLAWGRHNEVHAAPVTVALPSAPRSVPGPPTPDSLYFPETGHLTAFAFKSFWEGSGGLLIFGYPLTEEFQQLGQHARQMVTVQYFERQRFEYHPEHAGTPYEVELGQLGREDAERRNLGALWAFQPVAADAQHPPGCVYSAEARHRLCGEFRPYWEGHGLEFGDEGVSFREALALFGYPLSEESIDPETGLITQYFERAVFEYHPNNPPEHRVLLRRLGAERLARQGW